jgi:pimeloyl-ACP methyl ester carboxylesterase
MDLRGHGQSSSAEDYSQELFVADVGAVIDAAGLQRPILVGWSLGGSIAIRYAAEHPSQVAGLVLVDRNIGHLRSDANPHGGDPDFVERFLRDIEDDFPGRGIRALVDPWFPQPEDQVGEVKSWLEELCLRTDPQVILKIRRRGISEDRTGWMAKVEAPTLILQGGASPMGGAATGRYQQQQIRNSTLHIVEGHGHTLFLTAPEEFREQLASFLAAHA